MKRKILIIGKILLIAAGVIGILYLTLRIFLHYTLSSMFEPLGGISEGYTSYDEITAYFYTNKKIWDAMDTAILSITESNPDGKPDNIAMRQQHIKQVIEPLIERLPSKPEKFAVCIEENDLLINTGFSCAWQGWCRSVGYMWTSIPVDDGDSDEYGWVTLYPNFEVKELSENWFYYSRSQLCSDDRFVECRRGSTSFFLK